MKRFFICTMIASLVTLMSCNNDEVMNLAPANGEKVTVTANIKGTAATRVALTPDNTNPAQPTIKVDWNASGETFKAYAEGSNEPIVFTQTADTEDSPKLFEATLPETAPASYTVIYGDKNFTAQNGTLTQEKCVLMQAIVTDNFASAIDFEHQTAILKPTFKIGGTALDNNTITQITMGGIKKPTADATTGAISVTPATPLDDIYIFLPAYDAYTGPHTFNFTVVAGDAAYEATLTIPEGKSIAAGKLYTADITLAASAPYVTFTVVDPSAEQTFTMATSGNYALNDKFQYSVGYGEWKTLAAGEAITFGGTNGNLRLRGKSNTGTGNSNSHYSYIKFGSRNLRVACTGDIRTLVDWENHTTVETNEARFHNFFKRCTQLTTAPALPATNLANRCYYLMFNGCTALTAAPELPATTLKDECYYQMFGDCTALETAPVLPATTLKDNCYFSMFYNCTALETAPELPATTLAAGCYSQMFYGCTKLTTAPDLPATTLKNDCYFLMFSGCTALETAPVLPATTLKDNCYNKMFQGCSNLNSITMLATDINAYACLSNWVNSVAATGTFTKAAAMTSLPTGIHGIPEGWTVVDRNSGNLPGFGDGGELLSKRKQQ